MDNKIDIIKSLLWAKSEPYKSLFTHMAESGMVAQILLKDSCFRPVSLVLQEYLDMDEEQVLSFVGYIVSLHDIGKIHPAFIGKKEDCLEKLVSIGLDSKFGDIRHEFYGRDRIYEIWKNLGYFGDRKTRNALSSVIGLHHQRNNVRDKSISDKIFEPVQEEYERNMFSYFHPPVNFVMTNKDAVCMLLTGILIVSDWISSGEIFAGDGDASGFDGLSLRTKERMEGFLAFNHMMHDTPFRGVKNFTDIWDGIPRNGMRPLQKKAEELFRDMSDIPVGILIEAPMGEGKTETAMYVAARLADVLQKEGFYIGLPTAATSNQMYGRIGRMLGFLGLGKAKLMHSMAWIIDEGCSGNIVTEDETMAKLWTAPLRRGLISPFAVGTVDQVMMAVMLVRYGVLRLVGLEQKVLVIDEMHSYDAYMLSIIKILLRWCKELKIPVVILSATLPVAIKKGIAECYSGPGFKQENWSYPSFTLFYDKKMPEHVPVEGTSQKNDVKISIEPWMFERQELCRHVAGKIDKNGGYYCVLRNTVKEAQETYKVLCDYVGDDVTVLLFHAQFPAGRREEIENLCIETFKAAKERKEKIILVATQVVEQSLDLDFDYLVSDLCPVDLLLQRIGRLWRHMGTARPSGMVPETLVLIPKDGDYRVNGKVYFRILLKRTEEILRNKTEISLPSDIPVLVEDVYRETPSEEDDIEAWLERNFDEDFKKNFSRSSTYGEPAKDKFCLSFGNDFNLFEDDENSARVSVKTRLGEPTVRIALLKPELFQKAAREKPDKALAKEVLLHSLNVSEKKVSVLRKALEDENNGDVVLGDGLLFGIFLIKAKDGMSFSYGNRYILFDREIGFLSGKGEI